MRACLCVFDRGCQPPHPPPPTVVMMSYNCFYSTARRLSQPSTFWLVWFEYVKPNWCFSSHICGVLMSVHLGHVNRRPAVRHLSLGFCFQIQLLHTSPWRNQAFISRLCAWSSFLNYIVESQMQHCQDPIKRNCGSHRSTRMNPRFSDLLWLDFTSSLTSHFIIRKLTISYPLCITNKKKQVQFFVWDQCGWIWQYFRAFCNNISKPPQNMVWCSQCAFWKCSLPNWKLLIMWPYVLLMLSVNKA